MWLRGGQLQREALLPLLDDAAARDLPKLLVEPSAGGGRSLASKVRDLGPYLAAVEQHPWLGVCFDTCHAWAAGHDLATPGGMTATLDALIATVGRRADDPPRRGDKNQGQNLFSGRVAA